MRAHKNRLQLNKEDKEFAVTMAATSNSATKCSHLQWKDGAFMPTSPDPPPRLHTTASIMHNAHKKLGLTWKGSRKGAFDDHTLEAIADTGCQTCTAGKDILSKLCCPDNFMIPTSHKIVGITSASLGIVGAVMLRITINGRTTRQMVYVSDRVQGLYLSERALKDLGIISESFPNSTFTTTAATLAPVSTNDAWKNDTHRTCECPKRTSTPSCPDTLPYPATKENVPLLRKWLIHAFSSSAFNKCEHQPIPAMTGVDLEITFKEDTTPTAHHTPIPVAHHWKEKAKADLDRDERLSVIERVPQGTPTTWCSRTVYQAKENGEPRRTVDLQSVNKTSLRETHHTASPFNIVSTVPTQKIKTVIDAWNGYHSVPLADSAKEATTFITEWGRYRYCRAPMGLHISGDAFTRRFDDITADEVNVRRCVDDSLLYDDNIEQSFWHTFHYLKKCADNGILFNQEKFQFGQEEVKFTGFLISMNGYRPGPKLVEAIRDFPTPRNVTDMKSWFGLVNQVSYTFSQAELMAPFRDLLSTKPQKFYWDNSLDELFKESKEEILRHVLEGVKSFDVKKTTCLSHDWCNMGIGFTLWQKHCRCKLPEQLDKNFMKCGQSHWKIVFAGSRFLKDAESRYAPIEGEALSMVHALSSCRMFVQGCPDLIVATDHEPLTRVFNDRELGTIVNPRVRRLKEKSLPYQFRIVYIPGKELKATDAMSRHPVSQPSAEDDTDATSRAAATLAANSVKSITWNVVHEAAIVDEECCTLNHLISNGFPEFRGEVPPNLRYFWPMREDLYAVENVIFKGRKMLIPSKLRHDVMKGLHAAHQGVTSMLANARESFFWPGLDADIRQLRAQCRQCNEGAPSQPSEPEITTPLPEYPFQQSVMDLCDLQGHNLLIYADRYSGWIEVAKLSNKSFRTIRHFLLQWFANYGVPEELSSDGGPPFNGREYDEFLKAWDVRKRLSSAYYAQSNGRAEAAVKSAKRTLLGCINAQTGELDTYEATRALMAHRNTPVRDTSISPAMALYGRPIRDHLPRQKEEFTWQWQYIADARETALAKRHIRPDNVQSRGRLMEPLVVGDAVQIQNQHGNNAKRWHNTGYIVEVLPNRQYHVVIDGSRRVSLRNRKFLHRIDPICRRAPVITEQSRIPDGRNKSETNPPTNQMEVETKPTSLYVPIHNTAVDGNTKPPAAQPIPVHLPPTIQGREELIAEKHVHFPKAISDIVEPAGSQNKLPPRRSSRIRSEPHKLVIDPSKKTYNVEP